MFLGGDRTLGKVVSFPDGSTPCVTRMRLLSSPRAALRMLMHPFSPYGAPLQEAFEPVFARLGLPWTAPPNRMVAVFLATGLGMFGAQAFYLGERRRGLKYLAFCWTGVPALLGLRDALRLILMDRETFERAYATADPATRESRSSRANPDLSVTCARHRTPTSPTTR
jgi:TM2 domain-containing membrane protein YozV